MRGRLIRPIIAVIAQLDTLATAQDPDQAGPLTSGYDDDFREPTVTPAREDELGSPRGIINRKEKQLIRVPCQYEASDFEYLQQWASGSSNGATIHLVFHYNDLERLGLLDSVTNEPLIRVNDRLVEFRHRITDKLIHRVRTPPGLYATEVKPTSEGLGGADINLILAKFEDREQSTRRA